MKLSAKVVLPHVIPVCLGLAGCNQLINSGRPTADQLVTEANVTPTSGPTSVPTAQAPHYTPAERAEVAKLIPVNDPISAEIDRFRMDTRMMSYNTRRFDDLEAIAGKLRATRSTFGNGSWKIVEFYESLKCREEEPDSMWQLHDAIHQQWIASKPQSVTARVAYADFLVEYAWYARGSGWAKDVTAAGRKLFFERLDKANTVLKQARSMPEKDPYFYSVALTVALGQEWPKADYDALVAEAHAFAPDYWEYDTARAYSLLPRWHGGPGDWEAYAAQTAARRGSLGPELYARIVIYMSSVYDNVFSETKASWPKTRAGLEIMRRKYPHWLEPVNHTACLAILAHDFPLARNMFKQLGGKYDPGYWETPKEFLKYRRLAQGTKSKKPASASRKRYEQSPMMLPDRLVRVV